ncbi:MFS transporter [Acetobacter sp. KSO5]|uniref:MFS transporter n=1 Tax=Acetobacter sp. KSO5 TaxID=3373674 RepID=UPI00376F0BB8
MQMSAITESASQQLTCAQEQRRGLMAACLAHALHDGFTDGLYAFFPVWQAQFGLSYAGLAIVRALYFGTMGGLQVPADRLLNGMSPRNALVLSTLIAAGGLAVMAVPMGFAGLCCGLVLAGIGSSIQHPRASHLITECYGSAARRPLSLYNFSGDLGKATLPALIALLLPVFTWRPITGTLALLGLALSLVLIKLTPRKITPAAAMSPHQGSSSRHTGFAWLLTIGAFDTATRMGYLLFLPFLIHGRGGSSATVGMALALLFAGGALGKATCGWLGDRLGIVRSVVATETTTSLLIIATLFTPLSGTLVLLPLLGIVLNGTSSLLYGTVPELAPGGDTGRAFAVFYTGVIGAGGLAPIAYGLLADHVGRTTGQLATAATALLIVPMVLQLGFSMKAA